MHQNHRFFRFFSFVATSTGSGSGDAGGTFSDCCDRLPWVKILERLRRCSFNRSSYILESDVVAMREVLGSIQSRYSVCKYTLYSEGNKHYTEFPLALYTSSQVKARRSEQDSYTLFPYPLFSIKLWRKSDIILPIENKAHVRSAHVRTGASTIKAQTPNDYVTKIASQYELHPSKLYIKNTKTNPSDESRLESAETCDEFMLFVHKKLTEFTKYVMDLGMDKLNKPDGPSLGSISAAGLTSLAPTVAA